MLLGLQELPSGVEELTYKKITSVEEALQILRLGLKLRVAANTRLNEHSPLVFTCFKGLSGGPVRTPSSLCSCGKRMRAAYDSAMAFQR